MRQAIIFKVHTIPIAMQQRTIGFDLARAYAIFGMYIVNFNIVFGSMSDSSTLGQFLQLFNGNSSTIFVMLAGMGLSLMSSRLNYEESEKKIIRNKLIKRSYFLLVIGLVLYTWWPADILHFYGSYMHIAVFLLFAPRFWLLIAAVACVLIFHILISIVPYETGWNFDTLEYKDFWTLNGFVRNTFYNGWNPVFPWLAYFMNGMYLGRMDLSNPRIQRKLFLFGLLMYLSMELLQILSNKLQAPEQWLLFVNADYLPPFFPFIISTSGFGLMIIVIFLYIGQCASGNRLVNDLAKTGQMTLTHYISHLTIGLILFAALTGNSYSLDLEKPKNSPPVVVLIYSICFFVASLLFSKYWSKKYSKGPLEWLMRKITG